MIHNHPYTATLPNGDQLLIRQEADDRITAATRTNRWKTWSPPVEVRPDGVPAFDPDADSWFDRIVADADANVEAPFDDYALWTRGLMLELLLDVQDQCDMHAALDRVFERRATDARLRAERAEREAS